MKFRTSLLVAAMALGLVGSTQAAVDTFQIDPVHSSVVFTIRHTVSKVSGNFTKFSGTINVDRDHLEASSVTATIDVKSINTNNEKRDNHLKSPDFFDAEKFDSMTFKSSSWKKTGENTVDVAGDLTIHGVTKPVVLKTTLLGFAPGMQPNSELSGWEATTTINRHDFGVNGPSMLGKMLGDDVVITISVEAQKK